MVNNKRKPAIKPFITDKLKEFFEQNRTVALAYLFGSTLNGGTHEESDVDIAVLFDANPDIFTKLELTDKLCALLNQNVDLSVLNDASPIFKMQVITKGKLIFCRNPKINHYFVIRTVNEYDDLSYFRKSQEKNILKGRRFAG